MHFEWKDILLLLRLVLDILLVWGLVYAGIRIIRNNNRTVQILKGILAVFLIKLSAMLLNLQGANFLIGIFLNWGVILVMIILQPEIRGMLEKMGKTNILFSPSIPAARTTAMIDELMSAVENMSRSKTGALITLQMNQSMQDYEETGIPMDSDVSSELLETIFQYGTPMHDGAVIIEGDKIATAAAYYPSTSRDLPSKYGARHRAAVGISEVTDSITLVVSEETGSISVANRGVLTQYSPQALRRFLTNKLVPEENPENTSVLTPVINTVRSYSNQLRPVKNNTSPGSAKARSDDRVKPMEVVDMRPEALKKEAQNSSLNHGGRRTGHDAIPAPAAQNEGTSKTITAQKKPALSRRNDRQPGVQPNPRKKTPAASKTNAAPSAKKKEPGQPDSSAAPAGNPTASLPDLTAPSNPQTNRAVDQKDAPAADAGSAVHAKPKEDSQPGAAITPSISQGIASNGRPSISISDDNTSSGHSSALILDDNTSSGHSSASISDDNTSSAGQSASILDDNTSSAGRSASALEDISSSANDCTPASLSTAAAPTPEDLLSEPQKTSTKPAQTDLRSAGMTPNSAPEAVLSGKENLGQDEEDPDASQMVVWRKSQSVLDCQNAGISQGMHTRYSSSLKDPGMAFADCTGKDASSTLEASDTEQEARLSSLEKGGDVDAG